MIHKLSCEPFEYIPRDQRELPEEEQVVFFLRRLREREREDAERGIRFRVIEDQIELAEPPLARARRVLDVGLVGWKGEGENGSLRCEREKKGGREVLTDDVMDAIQGWAVELANEIERRSEQGRDDRKNS